MFTFNGDRVGSMRMVDGACIGSTEHIQDMIDSLSNTVGATPQDVYDTFREGRTSGWTYAVEAFD